MAPGVDSGMNVTVALSRPANGTHLVAGERATVTVTLKDKLGGSLTKADFATMGLYIYGPQETLKTVSAVKLLNATADRTKTPHHFIDLLTDTNAQGTGNTVTYALQAVSNEEAGTYTVAVRVVKKGTPPVNQAFVLTDFQLGTATAEKQIVEKEKCGACHLGADSGQYYFAHVDPSGTNAYGSPAIDSVPVRTCKACHNNEGYAAFRSPADPNIRVPDQIVRRVHGVHFGEELLSPENTDPTTGVFRDYRGVIFPANVKNCTACHTDDRWKTQPSRLACGTCHDNRWFGDAAAIPKGFVAHKGGPQANDAACVACHGADTGLAPISVKHKVTQIINKIDVGMTAPANGKFYVAGEKPLVTLVIRDDKGNPIDHTKVDTVNFSTASLFVYGPRYESKPVLTNAAKDGNARLRASATSSIAASGTPKVWNFAAGDTFKIAIHGNPVQEIAAPVGAQTQDQVVDWLKANLADAANLTITANATAGSVNIRSNIQGAMSRFEIYNSAVTTKMGWKPGGLALTRGGFTPGTTMEPFVVIGNASTSGNNLRKLSDPLDYSDPLVTRNSGNITYPLSDVSGLTPGTYMIYSYVLPVAGRNPDFASKEGRGFRTFQVGTETPDKKVATNCTNCHGDIIFHLDTGPIHSAPFDTDYCKACHDYNRSGTGDGFSRVGGTSTSGWGGYGAKPISARVHGVHRGLYLDYPEEIYAGNPNIFAEVIFPQDIRNCSKCHSADTTGTWKTKPSRVACLSCHDSDKAKTHAALNTVNVTPDPYGPKALETCTICHGAGKEFSPDKVHNVSNPYKPPYRREPE